MASGPAFVVRSVNLLKRELMEYQRDKNVRKSKLPQGMDIAFGYLGQPVVASAYISDCVDQLDEVCRDSLQNAREASSVDAVKLFRTSSCVDPVEFSESLLEFGQVHLKEHFAALAEQAARNGSFDDMVSFLGSLTHLKASFLCYEQLFEAAGYTRCVLLLKKCGRILHLMILQYCRLTATICFRNSLKTFKFIDVSEYRNIVESMNDTKRKIDEVLRKDVAGVVVDEVVDNYLTLLSALMSTYTPVSKDADRIRAFLILCIADFCRIAAPVKGKSRLKIVQLLTAVAAIYSPLSSLCKVVFEPLNTVEPQSEDPAISWISSIIDGGKQSNFQLRLFEIFGDSRCDMQKLLFVLITENFVLSRLIVQEVFQKNLVDCDSSFSSFFRCLVLISENSFALWDSVFSHVFFQGQVDPGTWENLSKKQIWVSTKPAWFEAVVSFLDSYTKPVVADIIAILPPPTAKPTKVTIKFEKMVKRVISTVTKQLSIVPLGLAKLFIEVGALLPNDISPVGGSVCLHFGICSIYRQLMSGDAVGDRSDAEFVKNLLLAVGERLCLCSDGIYTDYGKQIDEALHERLSSDHRERYLTNVDSQVLEVYSVTLAASLCCRKEDVEALQGTFRVLQRNRGWVERKFNIIQRVKGVDAEWNTFSLDVNAERPWEESLNLTEQIVFASKYPASWNPFVSQMLRCQDTSRSGFKEMLANRWEFKSGAHAEADAVVLKALKSCDNLVN